MTTANEYCPQIFDILEAHGVRTAYCSPGSRNVPLLIALEHGSEIETKIVVDERSCAFQALGCALISRYPVALICTSGSALLNFAPAVAEAYYAGVPLIVISADRPREWIDQDDSQTIRQFRILDHIVKGSYDIRAIPEGEEREFTEEMKWYVNRTVNEALIKAIDGKAGPVHINVQLAEPLGELGEIPYSDERIVTSVKSELSIDRSIMKEFALTAVNSRIMLVAGFCTPDHKLRKAVMELSSMPNVVLMAETISNVTDASGMSAMIDSVLTMLPDDEKEAMSPDIVISFGGALVSRMLKKYLRDYPPVRHWSVGHSNYFGDCFKCLTDLIDMNPAIFLHQLAGAMRKVINSGRKFNTDCDFYSNEWTSLREYASVSSKEYIRGVPWSDLKAFDHIFRNYKFDNIFVSNGTAVRYSQLIPHMCHAEYCNRGVSGIDGSTATAVGASVEYNGSTLLISGDMSWLYDSGASTLGSVPSNMRIIVIDNGGGGIFRYIPSTSSLPESFLDQYLCKSSDVDIHAIASAYNIEVKRCDDINSLDSGLKWLYPVSPRAKMLIVRTPAEISGEVLKGYFHRNQNNLKS